MKSIKINKDKVIQEALDILEEGLKEKAKRLVKSLSPKRKNKLKDLEQAQKLKKASEKIISSNTDNTKNIDKNTNSPLLKLMSVS